MNSADTASIPDERPPRVEIAGVDRGMMPYKQEVTDRRVREDSTALGLLQQLLGFSLKTGEHALTHMGVERIDSNTFQRPTPTDTSSPGNGRYAENHIDTSAASLEASSHAASADRTLRRMNLADYGIDVSDQGPDPYLNALSDNRPVESQSQHAVIAAQLDGSSGGAVRQNANNPEWEAQILKDIAALHETPGIDSPQDSGNTTAPEQAPPIGMMPTGGDSFSMRFEEPSNQPEMRRSENV